MAKLTSHADAMPLSSSPASAASELGRGAGEEGGRLAGLEGLRGVAAVVVVIRHAFNAVEMPVALRLDLFASPVALLLNAQGAVQIFFVLSGYVLAGSLERCRSVVDWPQFWIKRFFRIHPPYMFGLLLAWTLAFLAVAPPLPGLTHWFARFQGVHLEVLPLLHSLMFPSTAGDQFPVGWTLKVEMVFSLALPILVQLARPGRGLPLLCISLAILAFGPRTFLTYSIDFTLGVIAYRERETLARWLRQLGAYRHWALPLLGLALVSAPMWLGWSKVRGNMVMVGMARGDIAVMGIGAMLLVVAAAEAGPTRRVLSLRPALFLGRISYSLYLVHFPLLMLLAPRMIHGSSPWSALYLIVGLLSLSILISVASYRLVERPSISFGNGLCRAWARWTGKRVLETRDRSLA